MGCECVRTTNDQNGNMPQENKVITDYYTPTEENSADDFNVKEIQYRIDETEKWEQDYYLWFNYKGEEEDGPPRPGPHPDPKHHWNIYPEKFQRLEDLDSSDSDSDYTKTGLNSKYTSRVEIHSDFTRKKKSGVDGVE